MALKKRVILVGLGSIGKRHFRLLKERLDIIVEIVEPDSKVIAETRQDMGEFVLHSSFEEALKSKPDVIWLATPTHLHMQQSIDALLGGCHVFCEKPMATNSAEAKKIKDVVEKTGKVFFVGYYLRFWKGMTTLKNIILEGMLGTVLHAHARVGTYITLANSRSNYQSFNPGSIFLDYSHQPDLFYWLFGKLPKKVYTSSFRGGDLEFSAEPNIADIVMSYDETNSFSTTIHLNYIQMPQRHFYEITGDKAWALLDAEEQIIKIGYRASSKVVIIQINQERDDIFRLEHQAFFDMLNKKTKPSIFVDDCVKTQIICDAIIESWKRNEVVTVLY